MAAEFVGLKLAESVVSIAVERIADLLIHEASSLRSVRRDIQSLQTELKWIESFLKDADKKQEKDERVRIWIAEVRDVACEIEDSVETYVSKVQSSYVKVIHLRKLRAQVSTIQDKLRGIAERCQRYQIEFSGGDREPTPLRNQRRSYPDEEEDDVVTLKSTMSALKAQLMREEHRRCVVSVVGMGGLGKTTLAKKAYNDADVKNNFECSAWVFVSQQCVAREVLIEILMQVGFRSETALQGLSQAKELVEERRNNREILNGFEDHELVSLLKHELDKTRYLIVLDDIWSVQAWNSIEKAFPNGKAGSKVVFTTRIREVAASAYPHSAPIEPLLLNKEQSWELLKRKAFPQEIFGSLRSPPELVELGKEMVAECGGLPLAIVVLGGLLRTKNSPEKWEKVKRDVESRTINKLRSSERLYRVEDILDLSFQELPFHLKPCLLYLASFPEDSEISSKILIRLWMAEGFIRTTETQESMEEEVGEEYLEELIDRCMVQVDKNDHTGKRIKSCRLHDLMRDFCLSKAKEDQFLEIGAPSSVQQYNRSRRIALHVDHGPNHHYLPHPHLRSLLCFSIQTLLDFSNTRLLRVLHLDFLNLPKQTHAISHLVHLRYLRLSTRGPLDLSLPHSLGKLRNLQTLDLIGIRGTLWLPNSVWKLTQLRHLLLPWRYKPNIFALRHFFGSQTRLKLESLKGIHAKNLINKHSSVPPMPNMKVLEIRNLKSHKQVTLLLESLISRSHQPNIRSLTMFLLGKDRFFPKMELLSGCRVLSKLFLRGVVSSESLEFLPNSLAKLTLWRSALDQSKIAILEMLPNLKVLKLFGEWLNPNSSCQKWAFSSDGFALLEDLELSRIDNVEEWEVKKGSLRSLKTLHIWGMPNLKAVPEGLRYVTTLQEISIKAMTKEFEDKLRRVNRDGAKGVDFYKVRHVPSITFT